MKLQELIKIAKMYEDALHEHTKIDHKAPAHTNVDICSHLHAEVSELFNVIRRKKAEHEGMTYEEGILDELQDILCIWALAVNLLAPDADIDKIIENSTQLFRSVAKKKKDVDLRFVCEPKQMLSINTNDISWEPSVTGKPGLTKKMLYKDNQNGIVVLFKFEGINNSYPSFVLNGYADYYVMTGTLRMTGKEHLPSTFIHCDDGTLIDPVATDVPCVVLCNYEKTNYRKKRES
jgi:NTP pyrophosphatase (non-canonical NTP hydrolase)